MRNANTWANESIEWKFSFEMKTTQRVFILFAPTIEERDIWVNGINRIIEVPVFDPFFKPMGNITKAQMNIAKQV